MARDKYGKTRTIPYRRKRQGRTNYKKRLALLKSGENRLVIRKAINTITIQIVKYTPEGDKILAAATSKELPKIGWKLHKANIPSAYLTGLLLGKKAKKNSVTAAVLDIGLHTPKRGGRIFAALKGVIDAGVGIHFDEEAFPSDDRIKGKHIKEYADKIKQDQQAYNKQFSGYIKQGVKPEDTEKLFNEAKEKIMSI